MSEDDFQKKRKILDKKITDQGIQGILKYIEEQQGQDAKNEEAKK